jgi:alpha-beta hydrolase superfamily lysophospholipase
MSPSFADVLCHGSYHTPEPYQLFLSALQENGIEAYCSRLPSSDPTKLSIGSISNPDYDRDPQLGGYPQPADDAEVIKKLLRQLIVEESKSIVLMGHSSGGFTATAAAIPELQAKNRNLEGGIVGISTFVDLWFPLARVCIVSSSLKVGVGL